MGVRGGDLQGLRRNRVFSRGLDESAKAASGTAPVARGASRLDGRSDLMLSPFLYTLPGGNGGLARNPSHGPDNVK